MEQLEKIVKESISLSEVCRKLEIPNNGYSFKKIKDEIKNQKIDISHFTGGAKREYDVEQLKNLVASSTTISEVCRGLKIKTTGGNFKTLHRRFEQHNIDISHFEGKSFKGVRREKTGVKKKSLSDILIENSSYNRTHLKKRLVDEGVLKNECVKCGNNGEWLGEPISLQLDHINGVNNDNRLDNLRILCPNCHSQTSTYAGKNIK